MSNDLASLSYAISNEEDVRHDVAARVVATSSREALQDKEKVKKVMDTLQAAESRVTSLRTALEGLELAVEQDQTGLAVIHATKRNEADTKGEKDATRAAELSKIKFQLRAAERDLEKAARSLTATQKEADQRQADRLRVAKLEEQKREARETAAAQAQRAPPQQQPSSPQRGLPRPAGARSLAVPRPSPSSSPFAGSLSSVSSSFVAVPKPTQRVLRRVPQHLRALPRNEYSGGEVLPSLTRVQLSRGDIAAKRRRYQDDTDLDAFHERVAKRERLEAIAQQQQRRLALQGEEETKKEEEVETPRNGSVKLEGGSHRRGSVKREHPSERSYSTTQDVIDVDLLMEDDDEDAVEALLKEEEEVKKREVLSSQRLSRSPSRPTAAPPAHGHGEGEADEGELTLEIEEVEVVPGMRIDLVIYDKLMDYQQEGLQWLLSLHQHRSGGILGDEMGLGKTIQVAALINALHNSNQLRGPVLIVAPMTVLRQWVAELHRWAPYVRSCIMHDAVGKAASANKSDALVTPAASREALVDSVRGTPAVVVTTYTAMRMHCGLLHRGGFHYVILDEGHKISNPDAAVTLAAKSFTTPHRLILSGSPIQNSLKELWCLFDFVQPGLLGTQTSFIDEYETPIQQSRNVRASPLALLTAVECAKALQTHIAPYLLRRLKKQVNASLPPKYERVLRVPLTDAQLDQYLHILSSPAVQKLFAQTVFYSGNRGELNRDLRDSEGCLHIAGHRFNLATKRNNSGVRLESFRVMNQLRQVCNHTDIYAVQRGEDDAEVGDMGYARAAYSSSPSRAYTRNGKKKSVSHSFRSNNPVNLKGSGKLNALLLMLREWKKFGHRVLIFSQTRMMLDIIENLCEQQDYTYIRMDGTTSSQYRQELMDRFNEDDAIFAALLTTRVGGIGVNLIGADRVVIFDPDWNPVTDVQARERAWRIGQTREVCVYRLITSGTVEEGILRRQLAKIYVTDKVLKDPELQRFFQVQDSFMEHFLLGAEYEERVAVERRYLLAPKELDHDLSPAKNLVAEGQRRAEASMTMADTDAEERGGDSSSSSLSDVEEREEREFGLLVPVKREDEEGGPDAGDEGSPGAAGTAERPRGRPHAAAQGTGAETELLHRLANQQDISVSGADRVAVSLAKSKAQQVLQRIQSRSTRTLSDQEKEFSMTYALEKKKAEEKAFREEQGRIQAEMRAEEDARRRRPPHHR